MKCARTVCDAEGTQPHRDLPGLYCIPCGRRINDAAPGGIPLVRMPDHGGGMSGHDDDDGCDSCCSTGYIPDEDRPIERYCSCPYGDALRERDGAEPDTGASFPRDVKCKTCSNTVRNAMCVGVQCYTCVGGL